MFYDGGDERTWAVKELAAEIGAKANGLHYHLRLLTEAEMIDAADPKAGPQGPEKAYRARPDGQIVHWDPKEPEALLGLRKALLDQAKVIVEDAMLSSVDSFAQVIAPAMTTSAAEVHASADALTNLVDEFRARAKELDESDRTTRLTFTFALTGTATR